MLNSTQIGKNMLKHAKTRFKKNNCNYSAIATCVIQMSAHTRTWNLKAALGPKPCKVNQQYRHTNVNQHVLTEAVPNIANKNQTSSLRSQLSNHVQSVASPQYKHQLTCAGRRSSLISAFLWNYIQPRSSTICCWKRRPNQNQSIYYLFFTYMIHIHFVSTESKPQTHGIFYCWGARPPFQSSSPFKVNSKIVVNLILK